MADQADTQRGISDVFAEWISRAEKLGGRDTMLRYRDSRDGSLDLTTAHPSGMAQLMAGRPTRLASLIRDDEQRQDAGRRARLIAEKARELRNERSFSAACLAIGAVRLSAPLTSPDEQLHAPLVLRRVEIRTVGRREDDVELTLDDTIVINPAFVAYLRSELGIEVDVDEWLESTGGPRRFDARPVLERVRAAVADYPALSAEYCLFVSTFANVASAVGTVDLPRKHPILARMAQAVLDAEKADRESVAAAEKHNVGKALGAWGDAAGTEPHDSSQYDTHPLLNGGVNPDDSAFADDDEGRTRTVDTASTADTLSASLSASAAAGAQDVGIAGQRGAEASRPEPDDSAEVGTAEDGPRGTARSLDIRPLEDRDPREEFLALDVDGDQQAVVNAVMEHSSAAVDTPAGTGATQVAVAAATSLAFVGRSSLFVANDSDTLDDYRDRFASAGLAGFVVDARRSQSAVKKQLIAMISQVEKAAEPDIGELVSRLRKQRKKLTKHARSLHEPRRPWGISVYSTIEHLADLTSGENSPRTEVRLPAGVMRMSQEERSELRAQLIQLAQLGEFTLGVEDTVWFGARFDTAAQAEKARVTAERCADALPKLTRMMRTALEEAGVTPGWTMVEWADSLALLRSVESSMATFVPESYREDLDQLIDATGSVEYRRDHDVDMGVFERSKLKRHARSLVRSDLADVDLHGGLKVMRDQLKQAERITGRPRIPSLPSNLAEVSELYERVAADIDALALILAETPDGGDLDAMHIGELESRLAAMADDRAALGDLPHRTALCRDLEAAGLRELMDDLRSRRVLPEEVGSEFDLAYWATVLQQMAAADPQVGEHDGDALHRLAADFRRTDAAFVSAGASRLQYARAQAWESAIEEYPEEAALLRAELLSDGLNLNRLAVRAPHVLLALAPVWMMSPVSVPDTFGQTLSTVTDRAKATGASDADFPFRDDSFDDEFSGEFGTDPALVAHALFDTVIIGDAARVSVPEALVPIAMAKHTLALGDDKLLGPTEFSVAAHRRAGTQPESAGFSVFEALTPVVPRMRLHTNHRVVPQEIAGLLNDVIYDDKLVSLPIADTGSTTGLSFIHVDGGEGSPDSATGQVESPDVEVAEVVRLVFEHARTSPEQTLGVIALTQWHARRIALAVARQLPRYPELKSFFTGDGNEPFVITDAHRAQTLSRDAVIFTVGWGRSLAGRVLYSFGELSQPGGQKVVAAAVTPAKQRLTIVSCLRPDELDRSRLRYGAALLPVLFEAARSGSSFIEKSQEERGRSPLMADLSARVEAKGLEPIANYGGLDLAVPLVSQAGSRMVLAVEADGLDYTTAPSLRQRERLRPLSFARRGWTFLRVWSTDAFVDPQGQTERIYQVWAGIAADEDPEALKRADEEAERYAAEIRAAEDAEAAAGADSQGADGRGAGPGSAGAAGQQSRSAGAQSGSVKKRAQTPAEQAASLAALPEGAVEDQIMPAYDTGLLREADLIDAGLRDDEPAQPGRALDSGRNNDSAETGSSHDSGADRD
ncbi:MULTISPECIES: DUF4011 domain-containing protein [unclassified Brevibacterium]|uniref:DUF4011 domain-containing protein n=1 Tax=unclassified Brevibacterium TaxID=2614124 RepID=UPI0008A651BF|nr:MULTISPECIES: DUF4011 domain-containing protein [unclassified Brevibacterium]OFL68698.1 hypothetical protein HMPREF2757_07240 [Brevibacterium sp. HMSC063G07]OFS25878.1 hypothetical protein HMPREF3162_07225 [Brevibacterium sp. HMSC07C04]